MGFTTIPTYVTNQLITASHANTYWRDNINELFPHAAVGDLAYASALDALSALSIGNIGEVLKVRSGGTKPVWGSIFAVYDSLTSHGDEVVSDTSWADVSNITKDVTVPIDCSLLTLIQMRVVSLGSGDISYWRLNIDGNDGEHVGMNSVSSAKYVPAALMQLQAVSAGIRTVKLQAYNNNSSSNAYSRDHHLMIFGVVVP